MRKHIDYYYKCYDKDYSNAIEKICNECFNDYGYNLDSNSKRNKDMDRCRKTDCKNKTNFSSKR